MEKEMKEKEMEINSKDFWVNIVDFMQQYWALIEQDEDSESVKVYFIHEGSGVFASMEFKSQTIAEKALMQNGFKKFNDPTEKFTDFMIPPKEPYYKVSLNQTTPFITKNM
jgi:hypothetical protein